MSSQSSPTTPKGHHQMEIPKAAGLPGAHSNESASRGEEFRFSLPQVNVSVEHDTTEEGMLNAVSAAVQRKNSSSESISEVQFDPSAARMALTLTETEDNLSIADSMSADRSNSASVQQPSTVK